MNNRKLKQTYNTNCSLISEDNESTIYSISGSRKNGRSYMQIPKDLDLETDIRPFECELNLTCHADKFYYVLDKIILGAVLRYDLDFKEYIPINASGLSTVLTSDKYPEVMRLLKAAGVIEENPSRSYSVDGYSKSFRLTERFRSGGFRAVPVSDEKLLKRASRYREKIRRISCESHQGRTLIWNGLDRLEIDFPLAMSVLDSLEPSGVQRFFYERSLESIRARNWFWCVDRRGRIYNNFTNLKRDFRPLLTVDGRALWAADVSASQPALAAQIYPAKNSEWEKYSAIVGAGEIYDFLNDRREDPDDLSDVELKTAFKKMVFNRIYYGSAYVSPDTLSGEQREICQIFDEEFPELSEQIRWRKKRHQRDFALFLQREEASLVIDDVAMKFAFRYPNAPMLSIHDALVSTEEHVAEISEMLVGAYENRLGFRVKVKADGGLS